MKHIKTKVLFTMKKLFYFIAIFFISLTLTKADNLMDFEIEGMSIGDSALNFFNESDIKKNSKNYYKNKAFTPVQNDSYDFFKTYDAVDYHFKTGDKKYIIENISGILFYDNNVEECYVKMDNIVADLDKNFDYQKKYPKSKNKHRGDKTGKSIFTHVSYKLKEGYIVITCYDYSIEDGGQDHLSVSIDTNNFNDFLVKSPY